MKKMLIFVLCLMPFALMGQSDNVRMVVDRVLNTVSFWRGTQQLTVSGEALPSYPGYYVSNGGSDAADGLTPATAWETIAKVNAALLTPGTGVYFNKGDIWNEAIVVPSSGTIGSGITFGAYGTGANPIISGFTTIAGWTDETGGIYSKVVNCGTYLNMLSFDGVNTPMGRFPNTGWYTIDSHTTNASLTDADLPAATTNWTGADVVVRVNPYVTNHIPITDHTGNTISFSSLTTFNLIDGWGYFIQDDLRTLDAYKEWYYNPATTKVYVYFGAENPVNHTVKVAALQDGVTIASKGYVTFENITFEGFNDNTFQLDATPNITIQDCSISFCGNNVVEGIAAGIGTSANFVFDGNTIDEVNNNGIYFWDQFTNLTISNNEITDLGMLQGTGYPKNLISHRAIQILFTPTLSSTNTNSVIKYNNISNTGYHGISIVGANITINNNLVHHFCRLKTDGAGIYTWQDVDQSGASNINILNNIVLWGQGDLAWGGRVAPDGNKMDVFGIYLDNYESNDVTITGNTVAHITYSGYVQNSNKGGVVTNNLFYDCGDSQVFFKDHNGLVMDNLVFTNNILVNKSAYTYTFILSYLGENSYDLDATVNSNYNYYSEPIANGNYFLHWVLPSGAVYETLAQWQASTGRDANSYFNLAGTVADTSLIDFYYNTTLTNKVVNLGTPMRDMKNVLYPTSITLLPFTGTVLIPD